ncbi:unnamed protein product, partial [Polarella glacialis]
VCPAKVIPAGVERAMLSCRCELILLALVVSLPRISSETSMGFTVADKQFDHAWITKTKMPTKRSDLTATTVADAIYLIGGCASDQEWLADQGRYSCSGLTKSVQRYLPKTDKFEMVADAPRTRYRHAAAAVGKIIYVFGGCDIADNNIDLVDVLNTETGVWSFLAAPMPNATSDLNAFSYNGKVYVLGGYSRPDYSATAAMMIFDPVQSGAAAWSSGPPLNQGRGDAAAVVADGRAYVLGGFHHSSFDAPLSQLEMFDFMNPTAGWKVRTSLSKGRGDQAVASLHKMVHMVGGETKNSAGHSVPIMDVEVYSGTSDRWYSGGAIPSNRFRFVAESYDNSIFIFGGQGYLSGNHSTAGSIYPVLDVVEEYAESQVSVPISAAVHSILGLTFVLAVVSVTSLTM